MIWFHYNHLSQRTWTELQINLIFTQSLRNSALLPEIFLTLQSGSLYSIPDQHMRLEATLVFCYQICSDLQWEKIVLVIEKHFWNSRLKAGNLQEFRDHYNNLFKHWKVRQNVSLTCSWRFLRSNKFEQLEFKLEKILQSKPTP